VALDMLTLAIKAMGVDPGEVFGQAARVGEAFERIAATLERLEAGQTAMMVAMGLAAPNPDAAMLTLIADQSRRFTDPAADPCFGPFERSPERNTAEADSETADLDKVA
jgi:hypothetical protein